MKNWTLGFRIGFGFGIVLLIMLILGGMSVFYMGQAENNSVKLAKEYAPEVEMANSLERNFLKARMNALGYILSEDKKRLNSTNDLFKVVADRFETLKAHSKSILILLF